MLPGQVPPVWLSNGLVEVVGEMQSELLEEHESSQKAHRLGSEVPVLPKDRQVHTVHCAVKLFLNPREHSRRYWRQNTRFRGVEEVVVQFFYLFSPINNYFFKSEYCTLSYFTLREVLQTLLFEVRSIDQSFMVTMCEIINCY